MVELISFSIGVPVNYNVRVTILMKYLDKNERNLLALLTIESVLLLSNCKTWC